MEQILMDNQAKGNLKDMNQNKNRSRRKELNMHDLI